MYSGGGEATGKRRAEFLRKDARIGKIYDFTASLDEAKRTALSGRGYMLAERANTAEKSPLVIREVKRPDGSSIVRTYCAFRKKEISNYYIEEFARLLRKNFGVDDD